MKFTNILHLSDIHLLPRDDFDQKLLLKACVADLALLRHTHQRPSIVVVSGDLAQAADKEDAYSIVVDFLLRVADALGLDEESIVVCPGNHDASRDFASRHHEQLQKFRGLADNPQATNPLSDDEEYLSFVRRNFENFHSFANLFAERARTASTPLWSTYDFGTDLPPIIVLNTATVTLAGSSKTEKDAGKLFVPESALEAALEKLPSGAQHPLIVGHHPLEWLSEENRTVLRRILAKQGATYLCGHLHDPTPVSLSGASGKYFTAQSGALYTGRERWNGFSVVSLSSSGAHTRVAYRQWSERQRGFCDATDLANKGVFFSSSEAERSWSRYAPAIDRLSLDTWRANDLIPTLSQICNQGLTEESLENVFVAPEFERDVVSQADETERSNKADIVRFDQLRSATGNVLISGGQETGKTSILHQWAIADARNSAIPQDWRIPLLIGFGEVRRFAGKMETLVRQKLPNLPDTVPVESLLEHGAVTILVDDYDFADKKRCTSLAELVKAYPKCRYVFASRTALIEAAGIEPVVTPGVPFAVFRIKPMRPAQLLALIENYGTKDPGAADQLLDRLLRDAVNLNMPLTPVTGTFLIKILTEEPKQDLVNQAVVVERYIEFMLQKFAPDDVLLASFDYRNKEDFLGALAEHMVRSDVYELDRNEFLSWTLSYLRGYGLKYDANSLIEYFVHARILEHHGGTVRFRLRAFLEYFVATRMQNDSSLRDFIFDKTRYLAFSNEIVFYAALSRKDADRLRQIVDGLEELGPTAWADVSEQVRTGKIFETFTPPDAKATARELADLETSILKRPLSEDERRVLLDASYDDPGERDQRVARTHLSDAPDRWQAHLTLCSSMLKHMEFVPDAEKKRMLGLILDGWITFAAYSLSVVGQIATEKKIVLNGIEYKINFPPQMKAGEIARRLAFMMPIAVGRMAFTYLASPKLEPQIQQGIGDKSEPPTRQFFRAAILADLRAENVGHYLELAANSMHRRHYLRAVLVRKLLDVAIRYRLPEGELAKVKKLVANMLASIEGRTGKEADRRKSKVIDRINQERLLIHRKTEQDSKGSMSIRAIGLNRTKKPDDT